MAENDALKESEERPLEGFTRLPPEVLEVEDYINEISSTENSSKGVLKH